MAVDTWPLTLPQGLLIEGNQDAIPDGRLRTQTDTGPPKTRLRNPAAVRPISGSMFMTFAQWDILKDFVNVTLIGGTLPFNFPDPLTGLPILVQFGETLPSQVVVSGTKVQVELVLEGLP